LAGGEPITDITAVARDEIVTLIEVASRWIIR